MAIFKKIFGKKEPKTDQAEAPTVTDTPTRPQTGPAPLPGVNAPHPVVTSTQPRRERRYAQGANELPPMTRDSSSDESDAEESATGNTTSTKPPETLQDKLTKLGYKKERDYMSYLVNKTPHVGWKAHVGAKPEDMSAMIDAVSGILIGFKVDHKFDIRNDDPTKRGTVDKFLTIYPLEDEATTPWSEIFAQIEPRLAAFGNVEVQGDLPVGKTGQIGMRHGQLTPLMLKDALPLGIEETGKLGNYPLYTGQVVGSELPLMSAKGIMFFGMEKGKAPTNLSRDGDIYMAILYNGKIIPDMREEPNPAGAPLPKGVKQFDQ